MAGIEGNEEMNVHVEDACDQTVTSLAQSVQTLTARQAAPAEGLKSLWSLLVAWNTSSASLCLDNPKTSRK